MGNKLLALSSIFMIVANVPFIIISQQVSFIKYYYLIGLTTSLLNHSFNYKPLQLLDRSVMGIGIIIDTSYINNVEELKLQILSIFFYLFAKYTRYSIFHLCSHFLITVLHNRILMHS